MQLSKGFIIQKENQEGRKEESPRQDLTVDVKGCKEVRICRVRDLPVKFMMPFRRQGGLTDEADSKSSIHNRKVSDEALVYVQLRSIAASQQVALERVASTSKDKKVNLNKASLEELKQGQSWRKRDRILSTIMRKMANSSLLMNSKKVSGIGAKTIKAKRLCYSGLRISLSLNLLSSCCSGFTMPFWGVLSLCARVCFFCLSVSFPIPWKSAVKF